MEQVLFNSQNLKKARKKSGLTQESAAQQLNIVVQTIRGYEQGLIEPPISKLKEMGRLYGVTFLI